MFVVVGDAADYVVSWKSRWIIIVCDEKSKDDLILSMDAGAWAFPVFIDNGPVSTYYVHLDWKKKQHMHCVSKM